MLVAQGDLAGALEVLPRQPRDRRPLAASDPGNAGWQRDLSVSLNKVGDVLVAQGDLAGALKSYRDGLAIADRLAKSDPGNAGWQRDLSVSLNKVGEVLVRYPASAVLRASPPPHSAQPVPRGRLVGHP